MRMRGGVLGLALAGCALAAVLFNAYFWWATGDLRLALVLPAAALVVMAAAMPFTAGWRPFAGRDAIYRTCATCGMVWSPRDARSPFCPDCSGQPVR